MREIKFRGKDLKTGEWVYGDLEIHRKDSRRLIHSYNENGDYSRQYDVDEETIGQFTGMHDDDGTEIWEGDIVRMTETPYNLEYIGKVTYNAELGCYRLAVDEGNRSIRLDFIKSEIVNDGNARVPVTYLYEVIGNKYDNPELLKQ